MVNTTVKTVTNAVNGQDSDHFGGTDLNQLVTVVEGSHASERIQSSSIQRALWVTKSLANQTLLVTEEHVLVDASSNAVTITLPSAVTNLCGHHCIKRIDSSIANLVTVTTTSSQTIDGFGSILLADRGTTLDLISDGSNWRISALTTKVDVDNYRARGSSLNRFYSSELTNNTTPTTASITANYMYALPLVITKITSIDQVTVNVTTSGVNSSVYAAIYADNGNLYPGALIADFGSQASTSTGVKTFTQNLPVTLAPGLYWLVFDCTQTTPVVAGWAATQCYPILGFASSLAAAAGLGWYVSQNAGAFPNPFTAGGTIITAAPLPAVFVRVSG
jgi:hypothetical protein